VSQTTKKNKPASAKKSLAASPEDDGLQNTGQEAAETGSVDKIRDIIFGNQMRDYESRFLRLEQRMLKEISDLQEEVDKRFDSLQQYANKEMESMDARLKSEQGSRAESDKNLAEEIKEASRSLTKSLDRLEQVQIKESRELRQQLLDLNKTLSGEIREKDKDASLALDRAADELRANKVDRSALAEILLEIAVRMSDDLADQLNIKTKASKNE
jgi:hypothetical protein